jgi:hypothetical protein
MAITVYNDVLLPARVIEASGVRGKLRRVNQRTVAPSGQQAVNIRQARTMRSYEFGFVPMHYGVWQTLAGLFEVTDAGAYGFLLEDPTDISVAATQGLLQPYTTVAVGTIGLGYGVPSYRMHKRYTTIGGTRSRDRRITRPQSTPTLKRDSATVTLGASAGNAAINYDTGVVTFVADTSQAMTSITTGSSTTLNFANGTGMVAAMSVGQRAYVSGVSGTAASTLNGSSHVVASKGATSITLSVSTSGKSGTGGTAAKYPQATEALTWSGRLYVPVHFANDDIDWNLVAPGSEEGRFYTGPNVLLEEVYE